MHLQRKVERQELWRGKSLSLKEGKPRLLQKGKGMPSQKRLHHKEIHRSQKHSQQHFPGNFHLCPGYLVVSAGLQKPYTELILSKLDKDITYLGLVKCVIMKWMLPELKALQTNMSISAGGFQHHF